MIDIGFVFSGEHEFRELHRTLLFCNGTQKQSNLAKGLVNLNEKNYMREIKKWWILPFLIYMIASLLFLTMYAAPGIGHIKEDEKMIATILGIFTIFISSCIVLLDGLAHLPWDLNFMWLIGFKDVYTASWVIGIVIDTLIEAENSES